MLEKNRELSPRRKVPRVFLIEQDILISLSGVLLQWPDRSFSPILDLSLSGLCVNSAGLMGSLKIGQEVEARLRLALSPNPIPLKLKVLRMTAATVSLVFDSISTDGRLQVDQVIKDQWIAANFKRQRSSTPMGKELTWFHGPFETDILFQKDDGKTFSKLFCEYEGLLLKIEGNSVTVQRTAPTAEESRGYFGSWETLAQQKVSMGTNWLDRLTDVLSASYHEDIQQVAQFLKAFIKT